ncbi:hypothetical protein RHSIM_Rhsim12G0061300 [Rhododendron simsii]|uniref:PPIase cyclophilin-type domain-containing protein n=1 Tax=Rhododendron simsii TaxID=118357 RepID=A0A834G1I4_RHOSS|nr:hypothetical protein RHSIM_Rhsim12G0061300 [Rhododendron simsii]
MRRGLMRGAGQTVLLFGRMVLEKKMEKGKKLYSQDPNTYEYFLRGTHRSNRHRIIAVENPSAKIESTEMRRKGNGGALPIWILHSFMFTWFTFSALAEDPELGSSRVVFQTNYGDIEFGFYPTVAPQTVNHIFKLVRLGCYNTNHFFRVDKGFVAQVADVVGGRTAPMNEEQRGEAEKKVIGEFSDVKHWNQGSIYSHTLHSVSCRYSDPNSAQSSFSMLLGDAPHLDGQYAIFGKVTKGDETLSKLEELPTRREGIFVMVFLHGTNYRLFQPTERITIMSSYYYDTKTETCEEEKSVLKRRLSASAVEIERQRMRCFP